MSLVALSTLVIRAIALTPKDDTQGVKIKLKVHWKTQNFWDDQYINRYRQEAPTIAKRLKDNFAEWRADGSINRTFTTTCEDFAIRVLVEFAFQNNLPVKITCGVGTFRNMEVLDPSDDTPANVYGFMQKAMRFCAAEDMLNDINTKSVKNEAVQQGDLLVQMNDKGGARHVQVAIQNTGNIIRVIQGNQQYKYFSRAAYWLTRKLTGNKSASVSDPTARRYEGMPLGEAQFTKNGDRWSYSNPVSGFTSQDFLRQFVGRQWNFLEFNKE